MCYSVRCDLFYHHFTNLNTAEEKKKQFSVCHRHMDDGRHRPSPSALHCRCVCETLLDSIWSEYLIHCMHFSFMRGPVLHTCIHSLIPSSSSGRLQLHWLEIANELKWIEGDGFWPYCISGGSVVDLDSCFDCWAELPSSLSWGKIDSPIDLHCQSDVILIGIQKILQHGCMLVVSHESIDG